MNEIISYIENMNKTKLIILIVIIAILVIGFSTRFFANFLRDVDYLKGSLWVHLKSLFRLLKWIVTWLFRIIFFPIWILLLILENKALDYYIVDNSEQKDVLS